MTRAYFCITTEDGGNNIPSLHVNGQTLHMSQDEFFRLLTEAVWVSKTLARDAQITRVAEDVRKYYNI